MHFLKNDQCFLIDKDNVINPFEHIFDNIDDFDQDLENTHKTENKYYYTKSKLSDEMINVYEFFTSN